MKKIVKINYSSGGEGGLSVVITSYTSLFTTPSISAAITTVALSPGSVGNFAKVSEGGSGFG